MKKKIILPSFFLISVLLLTACAEKTDKESLNDSYESILTKEEATKYNKGKEINNEKDMRISFLKDEEYRKNFETMIALYSDGHSKFSKYYSSEDVSYKEMINYLNEIKQAADYIEKFDTKRVPDEELELLYELKILAVNIKKSIEINEALINGDKVITSSSFDSYIKESEDRIIVLENQYDKTLNMFERFLYKQNKATIKDYINKNIEFKEEK